MADLTATFTHGPEQAHGKSGNTDDQADQQVAAQQAEEPGVGFVEALDAAGESLGIGAIGQKASFDGRRRSVRWLWQRFLGAEGADWLVDGEDTAAGDVVDGLGDVDGVVPCFYVPARLGRITTSTAHADTRTRSGEAFVGLDVILIGRIPDGKAAGHEIDGDRV